MNQTQLLPSYLADHLELITSATSPSPPEASSAQSHQRPSKRFRFNHAPDSRQEDLNSPAPIVSTEAMAQEQQNLGIVNTVGTSQEEDSGGSTQPERTTQQDAAIGSS